MNFETTRRYAAREAAEAINSQMTYSEARDTTEEVAAAYFRHLSPEGLDELTDQAIAISDRGDQ